MVSAFHGVKVHKCCGGLWTPWYPKVDWFELLQWAPYIVPCAQNEAQRFANVFPTSERGSDLHELTAALHHTLSLLQNEALAYLMASQQPFCHKFTSYLDLYYILTYLMASQKPFCYKFTPYLNLYYITILHHYFSHFGTGLHRTLLRNLASAFSLSYVIIWFIKVSNL